MNARRLASVAVLTFLLALSPSEFASAASTTQIGDPVTDTVQLWAAILASIETAAHQIAITLEGQYLLAVASVSSSSEVAAQPASAAAAIEQPAAAPSTDPAPIVETSPTTPSTSAPSIERDVEYAPQTNNAALSFKLNSLINIVADLASLIPTNTTSGTPGSFPQNVAADGNPDVPYAAANNISNLSNVVLNSPTINTPSISNLSTSQVSEGSNLYYTDTRVASYINSSSSIPTAAGALGNVLAWNGSQWAATATSSLGLLGAGGGQWALSGSNVYYAGGNVGVGTTSPSTNLSVSGSVLFSGTETVLATSTLHSLTISSYPFSIKGDSTANGREANDLYVGDISDVTDTNGVTQFRAPNIEIGHNRNSGLDQSASLYIERDESSPSGTAPFTYSGGFGIWARSMWPSASTSVSATNAVTTSGGTSAGNHAPENTGIISGYGFGDTTLEVNGYGGMIHSLYVTSADMSGWGGQSGVFPKYAAQISAQGTSNDSIGFDITHAGVPSGGRLFTISSVATSTGGTQQIFKINGPLNAPGGTVTAGGTYADLIMSGNILMNAGDILVPPTGNIELGQTTATSSEALSLSSSVSGSGITLYNTADQTTNFSRGQIYSNNGYFTIRTIKGGTGADWPVLLQSSNGIGSIEISTTGADNSAGFVQINGGQGTPNRYGVTVGDGTFNAGSGNQWAVGIVPTISQSGSAGYTGLRIQPTESSVGAGANYLVQIGTSTAPSLFTIQNTGLVGVGTSTSYAKLTVWGPDTASTSAFVVANNASTTEFSVYDTGNAVLAGSLTQNSDQRLKTNIQSLNASSSLSLINQLNPVTFTWIDPDKGTTPQLGFIAQQVLPFFPNLIATTSPTALTPDGTLSLNYIDLISPIVSAIQALSSEVTSIENTIAGFANSFTTNQLTFVRSQGSEIDVHTANIQTANVQTLCIGSTCVTEAQLQALLAAAGQTGASASRGGGSASGNALATDTPPVIQINGDNPAIVQIGATYNDLGATITGPTADLNLGITTFLNGALTSNIVVDTSQPATDSIDYVATDQNGLTSTSTRTIIIEATN